MGHPIDDIAAKALAVMQQAEREMVAEEKAAVGIAYPPSSRPGEHPRKRSGNLQTKITGTTAAGPDSVRTTLRSGAVYSARLRAMGRLIFTTLPAKWRPELARRLSGIKRG